MYQTLYRKYRPKSFDLVFGQDVIVKTLKNIIKNDIDYLIPDTFHIKNIDKYVVDGEILLLNKSVRSNNKNIIKIFDEMAQDLLEEKKVNE